MVPGPIGPVPIDIGTVHTHGSPVDARTIRIHESLVDIGNVHAYGSTKARVQIPQRSGRFITQSWML